MTVTVDTSSVWLAKRFDKAKVQEHEAPALVERLNALAAWARDELTEVTLDVARLKETRRGWWRLKAPPFRVFFLVDHGEVFVGEIDRRDDNTYHDIGRLDKIAVARSGEGVRLVDTDLAEKAERAAARRRGRRVSEARLAARENPFSRFSDDQLVSLGIERGLLPTVRVLAPSIDIAEELARLGASAVAIEDLAAAWADPEKALAIFEEGRAPAPGELAPEPDELSRRVGAADSASNLVKLDEVALEQALSGRLEDWMLFLHPSQRSLVFAEPTGPMLVRGGPGTGKTVVALRRVAWLVKERGLRRVLATSFVRSLPAVWSDLFDRLLPVPAERACVVTMTVDKLVRDVLTESGGRLDVATTRVRERMLEAALDEVPEARTALGGAAAFSEEVDVIIAGRALTEEGYLAAARRGRRRRLGAVQRGHVWRAYQAYLRRLDEAGKTDWPHARIAALDRIRQGAGPRFDGLMVDEAQDLSEVQLLILREIDVDPTHSAVTLVADGEQAIYAGGSRLSSIGLDIRGRSTILTGNWRNSQFIGEAAAAVLGTTSTVGDDDAGEGATERLDQPQRLGEPVGLHRVPSHTMADEVLRVLVDDLLQRFEPGEIAVLSPTGRAVDLATQALSGFEIFGLQGLRGLPPRDRVSVGTYHRAKGLEFKAVVVTDSGMNFGKINAAEQIGDEDRAEEKAMLVRSLYVAMTRARDELQLIAVNPLPPQLNEVAGEFDVEEW